MNINKLSLEVSKCASTERSRYNLNGVHFTPKFMEATNGHILGRITYPIQFNPEEVPSVIKTAKKEEIKDFIIPLDGIKEIKLPNGKGASLPILNEVYIDVEHTNSSPVARFSSTNLETTPVTEIRKIDGEFPKTEAIWPKDDQAVFEINVDPHYLKVMGEIGQSVASRSQGVTLTFYGKDSPMKIKAYNNDTSQEFTGLIMPMSGDARDLSKPSPTIEGNKEDNPETKEAE